MVAANETVTIHQTADFERFIFPGQNRVVRAKHVEALTESLAAHGYLKECPVLVTKDKAGLLTIVDGQHRVTACQGLNIPVYYRIIDGSKDDVSKSIRVINAYTRKWNDKDYLHHFVALGAAPYGYLQDFMHRNEMSIGAALGMLSGEGSITKPVGIRMKFRNGELDFTEADVKKAQAALEPVNEIRNFHEKIAVIKRDEALIKALLVMCASKGYDHDRFLKNLELNLHHMTPAGRVVDYLAALSEIYNFRAREGNRIILTRKGMTQLRPLEDVPAVEPRRLAHL